MEIRGWKFGVRGPEGQRPDGVKSFRFEGSDWQHRDGERPSPLGTAILAWKSGSKSLAADFAFLNLMTPGRPEPRGLSSEQEFSFGAAGERWTSVDRGPDTGACRVDGRSEIW